MTSNLRVPLEALEPLAEGSPDLRVPLTVAEPLAEGAPNLRVGLEVAEPLAEGSPNLRVALCVLETLIEIEEGGDMATELFPHDLGRAWEAKKTPTYVTQVRTSTSLRSIRNPLNQYPAYDFEVTFPWLPSDKPYLSSTPDPDLMRIAGFFKRCLGQGKDWLFRDPIDYRVRGYQLAVGDGVTTELVAIAPVMGDPEPVGQVDLLARFGFAPGDVNAGTDRIAHAAHGLNTGDGPFFVSTTGTLPAGLAANTAYWAIADDANAVRLAASSANAVGGVAVNITDGGAGAHTLGGGFAVYVAGVLQGPAGVAFVAPNRFTLTTAPTVGQVVSADFDYLFVCHWTVDSAQFDQLAGDLFALNQITFRADPAQ